MAFEIDFLPVGDPGEGGKCKKSGDAIALRYGNLSGPREQQVVIVIDAGYKSSGTKMVEHLNQYYKTNLIDIVISTHPHDDHIQGLFEVLEKCRVTTLLMHKPWDHAHGVQALIDDARTTPSGTRQRLKESFSAARDLHNLAIRKGVSVVEPFEGTATQDGNMKVLGPSEDFYRRCIAADLTDQPLDNVRGLAAFMAEAANAVIRAVTEAWDYENLAEPAPDAVDPLNHSSTIIHFTLGDQRALFTADAGVQALTLAANYADTQGLDLKQCTKIQVPHHGSKRNVGPAILNRIIGPILPQQLASSKTAMLSAAKDGEPKHPSARVTNAFRRRGAPVTATKGQSILYRSQDAPNRGWTSVDSIPFRSNYDEED